MIDIDGMYFIRRDSQGRLKWTGYAEVINSEFVGLTTYSAIDGFGVRIFSLNQLGDFTFFKTKEHWEEEVQRLTTA